MADSAELKEARERKGLLYIRRREAVQAARETGDPVERRRQQRRAKLLWEMYQEACEEVRRLDPAAVKRKPPTREKNGKDGKALDVLMQNGTLWADLEGQSWSRLAGFTWGGEKTGTGRAAKVLGQMVREGLERCTPRQKEALTAYYSAKSTMKGVGQTMGVGSSTVSRLAKRGLAHVSRYVTAKLLIQKCVDREGYFDYFAFVNSAQVLTERQKEMMFLSMARDTTYRDMAGFVRRNQSSVWRTVERMENNLRGLGVDLDIDLSSVKVRRSDWENVTEKELAQQMGLSPRFYFSIVHWGERVEGIPLLHYVVLRRLRDGEEPGALAAELGCGRRYVEGLARRYRNLAELPDAPVEEYRPAKPRRVKLPENPYAAIGGDAIIDRIDAETYRKLQARFGAV